MYSLLDDNGSSTRGDGRACAIENKVVVTWAGVTVTVNCPLFPCLHETFGFSVENIVYAAGGQRSGSLEFGEYSLRVCWIERP